MTRPAARPPTAGRFVAYGILIWLTKFLRLVKPLLNDTSKRKYNIMLKKKIRSSFISFFRKIISCRKGYVYLMSKYQNSRLRAEQCNTYNTLRTFYGSSMISFSLVLNFWLLVFVVSTYKSRRKRGNHFIMRTPSESLFTCNKFQV